MRHLFFAFITIVVLALASPAYAEKRVALVIGNGAYETVPPLPDPGNDAGAVAELLKSLGFEVTVAADLDQRHMASALRLFRLDALRRGAPAPRVR